MTTPSAALDRLERDIASAEQGLARGEAPLIGTWTAPTLSGPPNPAERARALELGRRLHALEEALSAARDTAEQELADLEGQRRAARAYGQSSAQERPAAADN